MKIHRNPLMKKYLLGLLSIFLVASVQAQTVTTVPISDETEVLDYICSDEIILTDAGGIDGDYGPNESYTKTICIEPGNESFLEVIISPELYGDTWDMDPDAEFIVYDGADATAPILGTFNPATDPDGILLHASGTCLTFSFISGEGGGGAGFEAHITCTQPQQDFTVSAVTTPGFQPGLPDSTIFICVGDSITATAITNYPLSDASGNGYEQSDESSFFFWKMGDGTSYSGYGLTEISHVYDQEFGYHVTLQVTDVEGLSRQFAFYVLTSTRPDFSNIALDDTLCIGGETMLIGGITPQDSVGFEAMPGAILGGGMVGNMTFLPDGNQNNYTTTITIDDFPDGMVMENVGDIVSICTNMEHSYLGDLEMWITCPDGTETILFNANGSGYLPGGFGGGGTFLGDANDDGSNDPGIGFDYCFSADADWGTFPEEYNAGNFVDVNTFNSGQAMAPGTYQPETGFENFIGCPLNGDWTIYVRDNLSIDNGYIFSWSIQFNPQIDPTTVYYTPEIVDAGWEDNDDIVANGDTSITVAPDAPGNNAYTFWVEDNFGCHHDTTIYVYIRPELDLGDDQLACERMITLQPQNAPAGGVWDVLSAPTDTSEAVFTENEMGNGVTDIEVNDYGYYTFMMTENNCGYSDTIQVYFPPAPSADLELEAEEVLCFGQSITLSPGQQLPQNDLVYIWSRDGQAISQDPTLVADMTGEYQVQVISQGGCGTAIDSVSIVAIDLEVQAPEIICGLSTQFVGTAEPDGTILWTTEDENISFSSTDSMLTTVSSSLYGTYQVELADTRCPEDKLVSDITFVEQPVLTILPQNPDFCPEDSLVVRAIASGNFTGDFYWTVNGTNQPTIDDTLIFPAEYFTPLETYTISAQIFDEFQVCSLAVGSTSFLMEGCIYNIPNVFTPNGDDVNDEFEIQFLEFFPQTRLIVRNRWGNVVYENENYDQANNWDGDDLPAGTYYYELTIPIKDKVEVGTVNILR